MRLVSNAAKLIIFGSSMCATYAVRLACRCVSRSRAEDAGTMRRIAHLGLILEKTDPSPSARSRLPLAECRSFSSTSSFGALVTEAARKVDVEPRALAVRALLHLPRVASRNGWVTNWRVKREVEISAGQLGQDIQGVRRFLPVGTFSLCDLAFEEIDSCRAVPVLTSASLPSECSSGFSLLRPS